MRDGSGGGAHAFMTKSATQGLTLVHFSDQLEPFLTQNIPDTPPDAP
jgi:hypothetical protein